jgi:hypothetical protein
MTIHAQIPYSGNCGQLALVHVLSVLGIEMTVAEAHRRTGVSRWCAIFEGTDEGGLIRGIRRSRCTPLPHLVHRSEKARSNITRCLKRSIPVILLTEDEWHWMVLAGMDGDRYSWIDSADYRLTGTNCWKYVASWMRYWENGRECYFLIGVCRKMREGLRRNPEPFVYHDAPARGVSCSGLLGHASQGRRWPGRALFNLFKSQFDVFSFFLSQRDSDK